MRKAFLFLFLPLFSFAQETQIPVKPAHKNEIGVNLFSLTHLARYHDNVDRYVMDADMNYVPGIYYKRHFGKNALRASFDYTQKFIRVGNPEIVYGGHYVAAWKKNVSVALGYERSFGNKKLQPYVFSDLVFNYQNMTGERLIFGCFGPYGIFKFSEETFEYGASAGAGLRYSLNPFIHLTYEFSAQGVISVFDDLSSVGGKYRERNYHLNPVNKFGLAVSF
jgi:hypothetical protein